MDKPSSMELDALVNDCFLANDEDEGLMEVLFPPGLEAPAQAAAPPSAAAPPPLAQQRDTPQDQPPRADSPGVGPQQALRAYLLSRDRDLGSPFGGLPPAYLGQVTGAAGTAAPTSAPGAEAAAAPVVPTALGVEARPAVLAQPGTPVSPVDQPQARNPSPPLPQKEQQQQPQEQQQKGAAVVEELIPPKRGRGRPPKASGQYSAAYLALKDYRRRKKDTLSQLKAQLEEKLEQLEILTAENHALQVREVVLQAAITAGDRSTIQDDANTLRTIAARATAALAAAAASAAAATSGDSNSCKSAVSSGNGAALAGPGSSKAPADKGEQQQQQQQQQQTEWQQTEWQAAADAPLVPCPAHWSPALREFVDIYREYVRRLRLRWEDGRVRALHPWETKYPPDRELMKLYMTMSPGDSLTLIMTNLETTELEIEMPQGWWRRTAEGLDLTSEQESRISAAVDAFLRAQDRLMAQRRALQAQLAAMLDRLQARGMGPAPSAAAAAGGGRGEQTGSGGSGSGGEEAGGGEVVEAYVAEEHEELLRELRANMLREDRVWNVTAWALKLMVSEEQLGTVSVLAWPYTPRFVQICMAKLRRDGGEHSAHSGRTTQRDTAGRLLSMS